MGQRNLGLMYRDGKGVGAEHVLSHAWLNLASSQDAPHPAAARERDELAVRLTPPQIAEAQRLAREWTLGALLAKPRVSGAPKVVTGGNSALVVPANPR